jgi:hypothetical protein
LKDVLVSRKELARLDAKLLPVEPWNFTVPLNAAVITAKKQARAKKIVFISVEITVIVEELDRMLGLWEPGEPFCYHCHGFCVVLKLCMNRFPHYRESAGSAYF